MRKLIYHVAMTLDGFIAKPDGMAPSYTLEGPHVDDYRAQLQAYDAVIMGRATYEIGYAYGMKPGDLPYGDKPHYIVSETLDLRPRPNLHMLRGDVLGQIDAIKSMPGGDLYLCGGGALAGLLLDYDRIDALRIKLSPLVYGKGIRLFGDEERLKPFRLAGTKAYSSGVLLLDYLRT